MKERFYSLKNLDPNATFRFIMQSPRYGKARAELERRMGKCKPKKSSD